MSTVDTSAALWAQWINPSDVATLMLIIGGDVVRTALAQGTGTLFTPVCFSFGWVAYAFMALVEVLGDGRLLPPPDYPVKVFNLKSGYKRENQNWVIGRILRDHTAKIDRMVHSDEAIRIVVFEALPNKNAWTRFSFDRSHLGGLFVMLLQLAIAAIPIATTRDWGVILITAAGTLLALIHGALPQWTAEKLPNRQHSTFTYGLTTGNGSRDIMVIRGEGRCLNLEDFAVSDTPRNGRPWEKWTKSPKWTILKGPKKTHGMPWGFRITLIWTVAQSILWLALLVNVASVKTNTWYLVAVGGIGMFQNGVLAAIERPTRSRNLPLKQLDIIQTRKVMDGLMDLEVMYGCGRHLVKEFFPGELRPDEQAWWDGDDYNYDAKRKEQATTRGWPGGLGPRLNELRSKESVQIVVTSPSATASASGQRSALKPPGASARLSAQAGGRRVSWGPHGQGTEETDFAAMEKPAKADGFHVETAPARSSLDRIPAERDARDGWKIRASPSWKSGETVLTPKR